jgi:hypothetical protein
MPRQSMADLLSEVDEAAPAESPTVPARPAEVGPAPAARPPGGHSATSRAARPSRPRQAPRTTGLTESRTPKWRRLERKELRLWGRQLDELARLRRSLNRQRGGAGERITENTLIRVAVDLLLAQSGRLSGTTEDELRESVTS